MNEFNLIEKIKQKIPVPLRGTLPIGDDAGAFAVPRLINKKSVREILMSSDALVEGVDFKFGRHAPERIGHKALAVNLSDMAAMGAVPLAFTVTLGLTKRVSSAWVKRFYQGMMKLARSFRVSCIGGDLSKAAQLFSVVTVTGCAAGPRFVTRNGARPGDWIAVTGRLGGSLTRHHLDFVPRVAEAVFLARTFRLGAMIDVSDGLAQDLGHILKASEVDARIDLKCIPVARDAFLMSRGVPGKMLQKALCDGEDFELVFTVPKSERAFIDQSWRRRFPRVPLSWIGRIVSGAGKIHWYEGAKKIRLRSENTKGFRHFE